MTDTKSGPPSYKVGYSQPPVEHRFRKGVSGNPKGRGKGTKNYATIFMTAMTKSVTITENGTRKKISKLAAAATQLANDAARGDKKSIQLMIALLQPSSQRSRRKGRKKCLSIPACWRSLTAGSEHWEGASLSPAEANTLLDWCEAAMYDICITNNGVVPMTRCGNRPVDRRASARAGPCGIPC